MNGKSRTSNSVRNISVGILSQVLIIVSIFINRSIFIYYLGAEYLGINGLYNSILLVLSLAELGVANVMIFSLYKPVAENDKEKISALLFYFKKLYIKISCLIFFLGICIIPILGIIVDVNLPQSNLIIYYLLFLINAVVSYFFAYKIALINADQKNYIISLVKTIVTIIKDLVQIVILIYSQNYILYLLILIFTTLLNNLYLNYLANKLYPFLITENMGSKKHLHKFTYEFKIIKENIKATLIYKSGVVIMNNTDNILISILVGTVFVGYYSNYLLFITAIATFITVLIQAINSSIGNLTASEDLDGAYEFFTILLFFFHWLSAVVSASFLLIFNDIIILWIGEEYVLESSIVIAIVINFYIQNIINPVWIYRETMGLFKEIKNVMIYAALINLILSIFLGIYWGVFGIVISTALARILTTVWFEPRLLYRKKFNIPVRNYWSKQLKYFLLSLVGLSIAFYLSEEFPINIYFVILKIMICVTVISILFLATSRKSLEVEKITLYIKIFARKVNFF